jgi:hypothetical protein
VHYSILLSHGCKAPGSYHPYYPCDILSSSYGICKVFLFHHLQDLQSDKVGDKGMSQRIAGRNEGRKEGARVTTILLLLARLLQNLKSPVNPFVTEMMVG